MKLKIAQALRAPRSHTPANTLLRRACQALISDCQRDFREEVNICTVSCNQMRLGLPKAKTCAHSGCLLTFMVANKHIKEQ